MNRAIIDNGDNNNDQFDVLKNIVSITYSIFISQCIFRRKRT